MNASISVVGYKSKTLSNGEHPLMLRISKDGKKKYISIGLSIHPQLWDFSKNEPKPECPDKALIKKIILNKKTEYQKEILTLYWEQKNKETTIRLQFHTLCRVHYKCIEAKATSDKPYLNSDRRYSY